MDTSRKKIDYQEEDETKKDAVWEKEMLTKRKLRPTPARRATPPKQSCQKFVNKHMSRLQDPPDPQTSIRMGPTNTVCKQSQTYHILIRCSGKLRHAKQAGRKLFPSRRRNP